MVRSSIVPAIPAQTINGAVSLLLLLAWPSAAIDIGELGLSEEATQALADAVERDDWLEVEAQLYEHAAEDPSAPHLKALAEAYFENERYYPAAAAWRRADQIEPLEARDRLALATAYIALDRRHWARPEVERLMRENPDDPLYPYWLSGIYFDLQWFELALEAAEGAIALDPDFDRAHDRAGQCLESLGRAAEAEAAYRQALKGGDPWTLIRLAAVLEEGDEAERLLRRAIKLDSDNAETHFRLGLLLNRAEHSQQARVELERATQLAPEEPKYHYAFGNLLRRMGETELARQALERFRALSQ